MAGGMQQTMMKILHCWLNPVVGRRPNRSILRERVFFILFLCCLFAINYAIDPDDKLPWFIYLLFEGEISNLQAA